MGFLYIRNEIYDRKNPQSDVEIHLIEDFFVI